MELVGKVALVTGAGSGLGRAIAHRFGSEGTAVVVVDIDGSAAEETVEQMSGTATAVTADVADASDAEAMVRQAEAVFGGLDVLVNNAGGYDTPSSRTRRSSIGSERSTSTSWPSCWGFTSRCLRSSGVAAGQS